MEITIITKQTGEFFTASAFVGGAFAGSATTTDKRLAAQQARTHARHLVDAGLPLPLNPAAARLGGKALVPTFGVVLGRGPLQLAVQAAQLAAAQVSLPADEQLAA